MTEKETEYWLERQTRDLPAQDGSTHPYTTFRSVWHAYDRLLDLYGYTPAQLLGYVYEEMELQGVSFDRAFRGVVGYLDDEIRAQLGAF